MARCYNDEKIERSAIKELQSVKIKLDRQRRRESDEDTREAIYRKSATEFLTEN